jgi:hypothetical protein
VQALCTTSLFEILPVFTTFHPSKSFFIFPLYPKNPPRSTPPHCCVFLRATTPLRHLQDHSLTHPQDHPPPYSPKTPDVRRPEIYPVLHPSPPRQSLNLGTSDVPRFFPSIPPQHHISPILRRSDLRKFSRRHTFLRTTLHPNAILFVRIRRYLSL